jgi:hypothetical protein
MTADGGDWTGNGVLNEIAARVDRAGPRPVSEDHKPGLVSPDMDWLINYLAGVQTLNRSDEAIVHYAREIMYRVIALRSRGTDSFNLVGTIDDGFTVTDRSTKSEGTAKDLRRLQRAALSALSGSPTRWIKAWAAAPREIRRLIWRPELPPVVKEPNGFRRGKLRDLGIDGSSLIGPKPEDVVSNIDRLLDDLDAVPANTRRGNRVNEEASALADAIRAVFLDLCGGIPTHAGKATGPIYDFADVFDVRFGTQIGWRLLEVK